MSNQLYNYMWLITQQQLEVVTVADIDQQALEPTTDRKILQAAIYEIYLKYICIANKLEDVFDKMILPQKRYLIRRVLDSCLGRVIELKHDLVNFDMIEFSYNDEVMEKLKLTPQDTELHVPHYFQRERQREIQCRKTAMDEILIKLGWLEENPYEEKLTEIEAIRLIQIHERARQGRLRAHFMKEIRLLKEKSKSENVQQRTDSGLLAAMRIQKMWRGHTARRITRRKKVEEMVLIGMIPSRHKKSEEVEQMNQTFLERYKAQEDFRKEYDKAVIQIREQIITKHDPVLMDDIADEIRLWIKQCYDKTGKLPDFPSKDNGGSLHIFSRAGTESEMGRSSARSSKESRKTKDKPKSPARSGDLNVIAAPDGLYHPSQSMCFNDLKNVLEE